MAHEERTHIIYIRGVGEQTKKKRANRPAGQFAVFVPEGKCANNGLFSAEREALEVRYGEALLNFVEELSHRLRLVPDVFLIEEANFLEELSQTTLSNVLDHLFVEVSFLLSGSLRLELADFFSLFLCDATLHHTFLEVLFTLGNVEVETGLLEAASTAFCTCSRRVFSIATLSSFVLRCLGYAALIDSHGRCRSDLHSHVLTYGRIFSFGAEGYEGAEGVVVLVVVSCEVLAFYHFGSRRVPSFRP